MEAWRGVRKGGEGREEGVYRKYVAGWILVLSLI